MNYSKNICAVLCASALSAMLLCSCGGSKNLIVPRSVSTMAPVKVEALNLTRSDYEVLRTIKEQAVVNVEYRNTEIRINDGDGEFSYKFKFDKKTGWSLASFSGIASMGYFAEDFTPGTFDSPNPEDFARRVAIARLMQAARDFGADGIIEPMCTTTAVNSGHSKVSFTAVVSAKMFILKTNN